MAFSGGGGFVGMQHPDYEEAKQDWEIMRDALSSRLIKEAREKYLPMPDGFRYMPDRGAAAYQAYLTRAKVPPLVEPILRGMAGILNRTEPKIEIPKALEPILERATATGDPIEIVYRRVIRELLTTGRCALLTDMPEADQVKSGDLPYLAFYEAERLINWSRDRTFFVIDETRLVREGFVWFPRQRYRMLELDENGNYQISIYDYLQASNDTIAIKEKAPIIVRGGKTFDYVPLVVMGALDLEVEVGQVPLLGVAEAAYAGYRLDADYRYQLYMSGQETFVVIGLTDDKAPKATGPGVMLMLPASCDAKYVGPNAVGIQAHRQAMQDESEAAALAGARMFTNAQTGRTAESGDALKLRFSGETATLVSIAQSAAQGLERALKAAAFFVGADPEQVSVTPNLDLVDATLPPADAVQLMQLWLQGAISKMTLYENLQKGEIASQERTLDEEQALIDEEVPPQQSTNSVPPQGSNSLTSAPTNAQIASWRADHANAQDIRTERESLAKAQASGGPNKGNPGAANSGSANKGSGNKGAV